MSDTKKAGIRFEKQWHDWAEENLENYHRGQWWHFRAAGGRERWCQTDGVLLDPERKLLTIIECKIKHTVGSYWQLEKLYKPVLYSAFDEEYDIRLIEVCRHYDPEAPYPRHTRIGKLDRAPKSGIGVLVWEPPSPIKVTTDLLSKMSLSWQL